LLRASLPIHPQADIPYGAQVVLLYELEINQMRDSIFILVMYLRPLLKKKTIEFLLFREKGNLSSCPYSSTTIHELLVK
jgi:hypothetical protein